MVGQSLATNHLTHWISAGTFCLNEQRQIKSDQLYYYPCIHGKGAKVTDKESVDVWRNRLSLNRDRGYVPPSYTATCSILRQTALFAEDDMEMQLKAFKSL